jgi:recA bacterial DNA recombination protein
MSSAVVSTSAALSRPFVFDAEPIQEVCPDLFSGRPPQPARLAATGNFISADPKLSSIVPASCLEVRPAPEMASSGISAIDALTGGLPRGCLTEICGPISSGRTTLLLAALAAATRRGEFCVIVDGSDSLDPHSAVAAGVELDHLLWVRCGEDPPQKARAKQKSSQAAFKFAQTSPRQAEHCLEQLLRATDLLLESGGFGLIALDLCDVPPQAARRIPLTTWFRFRRAVEHKSTILLAFEQQPIAGSCSSLLLKLGSKNSGVAVSRAQPDQSHEAAEIISPELALSLSKGRKPWVKVKGQNEFRGDGTNCFEASENVQPAHVQLLTQLEITANLDRSRFERKPSRSATIAFVSKTAWAG